MSPTPPTPSSRAPSLGIDIGVDAVHAVLIDADGGISAELTTRLPDVVEIETDHWFEALRETLRSLVGTLPDSLVIGLSAQEGAFTLLDDREVQLASTPLIHDRRSEWAARELRLAYGRPIEMSHLASRLHWWKTLRADAFQRAHRALTARALVHYRLTGKDSTDAGDASTTGLFDLDSGWKEPELSVVDPKCLELVDPGANVGSGRSKLLPDAAEFLGLPARATIHTGSSSSVQAARALGLTVPGPMMIRIGRGGCAVAAHPKNADDAEGWCQSLSSDHPHRLVRVPLPDVLESVRAAVGDPGREDPIFADPTDPNDNADPLKLADLRVSEIATIPLAFPSLLDIDRPPIRAPSRKPSSAPREDFTADEWYRTTLVGAALHCAWALDQLRAAGVGVAGIELVVDHGVADLPREFPRVLATVAGAPVRTHTTPHLPAIGAAIQAAASSSEGNAPDGSGAYESGIDLNVELPGEWVKPITALTRKYAPLLERFSTDVRRMYRARSGRQDPPKGYVQNLLSTDW